MNKKYEFRVTTADGIGINFDTMENDKEEQEVYAYIGNRVVFSFDPRAYQLKFDFKGRASKTIFFDLIKR
jgi:hypothetical protein